MATTPEGRVKNMINKRLAAYPAIWRFMPVQRGYGDRALDYILCVPTYVQLEEDGDCVIVGVTVLIEAKRPGGELRPTQIECRRKVEIAGGKVFVVEDEASMDIAMKYINDMYALPVLVCGPGGAPL